MKQAIHFYKWYRLIYIEELRHFYGSEAAAYFATQYLLRKAG